MNSHLAKNTFYLTFASIGQKLIAFIYFLFVARALQPELTGKYFLAVSIAMIFSVLADFGITSVVVREIAKSPEKTVSFTCRALTLKIPFLLLGYACAVSAAWLFGYEMDIIWLTALSGLSLILDSVHLFFYGVLRGHQRLNIESVGMLLGQIITAIIGGIILWISPSLMLLMLALVAGSLTNALLSGSILLKRYGIELLSLKWDPYFARQLMRTALPFALAAIFVKVYSYVDTLFISKWLNATSVGLYGLAYKLTYAFQFLPLAFTAALYPNFSASVVHNREQLPKLFHRAMWYMMLISIPISLGIWIIAEPLVLLAGSAYQAAAPVLSVLVFVLIPIFLDFPVGSLLNASNKQSTKTKIMGATMLINIVMNVILIPIVGMLGAAIAALVSFIFMLIAGLYFVSKLIPEISLAPIIRDMILIVLSGFVMAIVGKLTIAFIGWIIVIPLCGFVYFFTLFFTRVLTIEDLKQFKSHL